MGNELATQGSALADLGGIDGGGIEVAGGMPTYRVHKDHKGYIVGDNGNIGRMQGVIVKAHPVYTNWKKDDKGNAISIPGAAETTCFTRNGTTPSRFVEKPCAESCEECSENTYEYGGAKPACALTGAMLFMPTAAWDENGNPISPDVTTADGVLRLTFAYESWKFLKSKANSLRGVITVNGKTIRAGSEYSLVELWVDQFTGKSGRTNPRLHAKLVREDTVENSGILMLATVKEEKEDHLAKCEAALQNYADWCVGTPGGGNDAIDVDAKGDDDDDDDMF